MSQMQGMPNAQDNAIKINKPTFNIQINNNVQYVQPHGQAVTNVQGTPNDKHVINPSQLLAAVTAAAS